MKSYYLLTLGMVFLLFASCDKIKEATTVEIETELEVEIPIATTGTSNATKSADAGINSFQYGGNATFSLADNEDLADYVNNIDEIIADGVATIQINGVPVEGSINTCLMKFGIAPTAGTTAFNLTTPVVANNGIISITDVAWVNGLLNTLKQNMKAAYKFDVSGDASFDVNHVIKIKVPVLIKANPL
ncbi:MAG TPA: hypothetical protein DER09_11235 [Prolixibacteraceae bacterium]|nr:hypothetical protein [Prolixibacteraceae bacterium]